MLLLKLTSAEWAAWVQAIGSVVAIFAAAYIARHQSRLQHRSALDLHMTELRTARVDMAKTLSVLAANASKVMQHIAGQLNDRESVYRAAEGFIHCDLGELRRIDTYLNGIPIHSVPYSLVTITMTLGSTVRQFKEKVETTLRLHRQMNESMFDDFFRSTDEMNASIEATCCDIEAAVKSLNT
ncbi:hypothetical protein [Thiobacillus sp. 65-1402]|uniref:hypothetical protein n=1 Tax=Thiobacillus sp. 65-1402 TaxID=1895861 RepID=UPI0025E5EAED|nr:hypothetical protein [Thiobacillus sp. 65-1402]